MTEDVDSFASMFDGPPSSRRPKREARAQKERRTQQTAKQRHRGAIRTEQINYRCSPQYKAKLKAMQKFLGDGWAIADVAEAALDALAQAKGFEGDAHE